MPSNSNVLALAALPGLVVIAIGIVTLVVHIGFAAAVAGDASQLRREQAGPLIAGPLLWTVATLLGGVPVAVMYWLVNHSTLSRR